MLAEVLETCRSTLQRGAGSDARQCILSAVKTVIIFPTIVRAGRCILKESLLSRFPPRAAVSFSRRIDAIRFAYAGTNRSGSGRTAGRTTTRYAVVLTPRRAPARHRVKMKWPGRINNCTKGASKIEVGRTFRPR